MSTHPDVAAPADGPGVGPGVDDVPWALAAWPSERLAAGLPSASDPDRAGRKFATWLELSALRDAGDEFDTRLAPTGMAETSLRALLGEPGEALATRLSAASSGAPDWYARFAWAWRRHQADLDADLDAEPGSGPEGTAGMLEVARPVVLAAVDRMRAEVEAAVAGTPALAGLTDVLRHTVPELELAELLSRTMILELNVARLRGQLHGDTGADRYASYLRMLRDPAVALAIWREYPVLARLVDDTLTAWSTSCVRLAHRLAADLDDVREHLWGGADPGAPVSVSFGEGDRHRGQTVAIVTFEHEAVVYKPRSLAVDAAFQRYLDWFNATGPRHKVKIAATLCRDDYGWCEFIDAEVECTSAAEVAAFYWRLGAELALLHSLSATDFHFENLIASGAHPVLIDMEALFDTGRATTAAAEDTPDPASKVYEESVLSVGLLPSGQVIRDEDDKSFRFDISGIGGDDNQRTPVPVATLDQPGTDEMRMVRKRMTMNERSNRPRLGGAAVSDLLSYRDDIVAGFVETYRRIAEGAPVLLAPGGVLDGFADTPVRLILRPTFVYGQLLQNSTHPDFLRDAMDRECCLAQLCRGWATIPNRIAGISAEIDALRRGDIPLFEFRPGGTELRCDDGTTLPAMFDEAPLDTVRDRIAGMGPDDLAVQLTVIDSVFAAMQVGDESWAAYAAPRAEAPVDAERLRAAALAVGGKLADTAVVAGDRVGWFGLTLIEETYWQFVPAGPDLYSGIAGIGLFLSALGTRTGDARMLDMADLVLRESVLRGKGVLKALAARAAESASADTEQVGAFATLGGLAYYWAHAAVAHGRTDHLEPAPDLLAAMARRLADDVHLDVISGLPGAIFALLALHEAAPELGALAVARQAGDLLVQRRLRIGDGCAWPSQHNKDTPLAGFSHGASGVAAALARLHAVAPDPEYLDAVTGAIRYESTMYDAEARNWRDVRELSGGTFMVGWCHGAAGVGLARHDLLRHDFLAPQRDALAADLTAAVGTTVAAGLDTDPVTGVSNHSICHGDLGNIELLAAVAGTDPAFPGHAEVGRLLGSLADFADTERWLCGVPGGTATPGLMPGLAGIGYNLLRFADPGAVPSVLLVEPPSGRP